MPLCVVAGVMSAVGQHIPEHGKSGHLHAAEVPLPRVAETSPSTPELPTCRQQHGGQVTLCKRCTSLLAFNRFLLAVVRRPVFLFVITVSPRFCYF